jgi:hypothetical protein
MPSLRVQLGSVGVALVASVAACSSILGIHEIVPPSDGGADTGSDADHGVLDANGDVTSDADAFDAGQDALDAGTDALDTGMDALDTGMDAPLDSFDAPADALADAPAQPGDADEPDFPCAQQGTYLFCDDFDSVTSVGQNWSGSGVALEGGTWSLDTADYVSAPASARAAGPALTSSQYGQEDDDLDVPPLTSWIRLAFDLRVDLTSYVGCPYLGIANLYVNETGTSILYAIQQNGSAEIVAFNPHGAETYPVAAPPLGTWVRIVLQYDGSIGMTAWQSGTQIASDGTCAGATPSSPQLFLGAAGVSGASSEPFALEIDNVVVRGK